MRPEEPLGDTAVLLAGEGHAVAFEVRYTACGALGHDAHGVRVGEKVALLERVGGVLLPGVLGVDRGEGRVDPARRERGVRIRLRPLAHGEDVDPAFGEFYGGAQAGSSYADDEDGCGDPSFGRVHVCSSANVRTCSS